MNFLKKKLYQHYLPNLIKNKCDDRIPRSGDAGRKTNCFLIYLNQNNQPYLLVENILNDELNCLQYNGHRYEDNVTINIEEIDDLQPQITHYYGLYQITYSSIYGYLLENFTYYLRLKINITKFIDYIFQYLFNRRSLETKQRYEFLKLLTTNFIGIDDGFSYVDVIRLMHTDRIFLHPEYRSESKKIAAYLEAFVDTQELKLIKGSYHLSGLAFKAIEDYEEQDRKHRSANRIQYIMVFLTIVLAFFAAVQAGVITLPMLINLS